MPRQIQNILLLILLGHASGCAGWLATASDPARATDAEGQPIEPILGLPELQERTGAGHPAELRARAHLELGFRALRHDNPERDYVLAKSHFEQYVVLAPDGAAILQVRDWLAALDTLQQAEKRAVEGRNESQTQAQQLRKLQSQLEQLQSSNNELREAVTKLRTDMEKLERLDVQIEQKRRDIR